MEKKRRIIHHKLKKRAPKAVHKVKKLFRFKYPKLFLFVVCIALAYILFNIPEINNWVGGLGKLSYFGIFMAGMLIAFGFSAPFSVGFFIVAEPNNLLLATLIGGLGAAFSDLLIFKTIKFSFQEEFNELEKTKTIQKIEKIIKSNKNIILRHYLLYVFAGILIATPLPDEVGISMLAGLTTIKPRKLVLISFFLHTIAIFLILYFSIII